MTKQDLQAILANMMAEQIGGKFGAVYLALGFLQGALSDPEAKDELAACCKDSLLYTGRLELLRDQITEILKGAGNADN